MAINFYSLGLNIFSIGNKLNLYNFNENNILKSPNSNVENHEFQRQTKKNISSINWNDSVGLGLSLGFENVFAIDIDGCVDINFILNICKILELPNNYEWILSSGSLNGYHIIFKCDDKLVLPESNTKVSGGSDPEVPFGSEKTNAYYPHYTNRHFNKIEFKWAGEIVMPYSLHITGNEYKALNKIPNSFPKIVNFKNILAIKEEYCSLQCDPSDLGHNYYVTHQFVAHGDEVSQNYQKKGFQNYIIIDYTTFEIEQKDYDKINSHLVQINWYVLDKNYNQVKRKTVNYFKNNNENELVNFEFHNKFENTNIFEKNHLNSLKKIDFDVALKISTKRRDALFELIFDIEHIETIIANNEMCIDLIKLDLYFSGLYIKGLSINSFNNDFSSKNILLLNSNSTTAKIQDLYNTFLELKDINTKEIPISESSLNWILNNAEINLQKSLIKNNNESEFILDYEDPNIGLFDDEFDNCEACGEIPCMCSDREKTSTNYDFY